MWLISAGVTAVVMGMLPVGVVLTRATAGSAQHEWWVFLFWSGVCFALTFVAASFARLWESNRRRRKPVAENSWWALGEMRGQEFLIWVLGGTAVLFVAVALYELIGTRQSFTLVELTRTLLTFGLVAVALVDSTPVIPSCWPPTLPTINPAQLPEEIDQKVLFSVPMEAPDDPDVVKLSVTCDFRSAASLRGEKNRRSQHTIHTWVYRSQYDEYVRRDHPTPDDHADGPAVLERYIREGLSENIHVCAGILWRKAGRMHFREFERTAFILAFVRDAIDEDTDDRTSRPKRFARYPIETLTEKRGTPLDRIVLAGALLYLVDVKPLLVIPDRQDRSFSAGLAIPLVDGLSVPRTGLIEFEDRRYVFHEWDAKQRRWHVEQRPTGKVLLISLE